MSLSTVELRHLRYFVAVVGTAGSFEWLVRAVRSSCDEFCARICARMTTFSLASREDAPNHQKSRSPLVNELLFEAKRNVVKSTVSES
jgi:hypothetical protein